MPEVFVETVLDGQRGEDGVVDEGRPEVGQRARRVAPWVLVEVSGDHVVEDGVAEELEPLVAVGEPVGVVRGVGEGLKQVGPVAEAVPDGGLECVVTPDVSDSFSYQVSLIVMAVIVWYTIRWNLNMYETMKRMHFHG